MSHNLYLTFSEEDGYGLSYIRAEDIIGNTLYTIFWFVILRVFLDLMKPAQSTLKIERPSESEGEIFKIEIEPEKKDAKNLLLGA